MIPRQLIYIIYYKIEYPECFPHTSAIRMHIIVYTFHVIVSFSLKTCSYIDSKS